MKRREDALTLLAFLVIAALWALSVFEPVKPDEQDCIARGKSESCMTEVYAE